MADLETTLGTNSTSPEGNQQPVNGDSLTNIMAGGEGSTGDTGNTEPKPDEGKLSPWADQLPEDMRGNKDIAKRFMGFKKIGDLAKSYMELEDRVAKSNVPESSEGYDIAKEQDAAGFLKMAMESKLTNEQATALYKQVRSLGESSIQALQQAQKEQLSTTDTALKAEYGAKYPEKIEFLKRGLAAAGGQVASVLRNAGIAGHPDIVRTFIAFGEMTSESGGAKGKQSHSVKSLMEGGQFSYEEK